MQTSIIRHALRATLAATLAMACVKALGMPSGFWAPLSALAVLQAQIGASLVASRNYLIASAIGVVLGATIVSVAGDNVFYAGAGIFPIVLLAMAMKLPPAGASVAAGVVPVLVLAVTGSPWRYGVYRLIDIAIGLASAIVVSLLLWPMRAVTQLRSSTAGTVRDATSLTATSVRSLTGAAPRPGSDLEARAAEGLTTAQGLLTAARQEPLHAAAHDLLPFYVAHAERIVEHAKTVCEIAQSGLPGNAVTVMAPSLTAVAGAIDAAGATLANAIETGVAGRPLDGSAQILDDLHTTLAGLRAVDVTALAQSEELLRLYSLVVALDSFGREIDWAIQHIEHPDQVIGLDGAPARSSPAGNRRMLRFWRRART